MSELGESFREPMQKIVDEAFDLGVRSAWKVIVERVDVDAAWEVYYRLVDRRHQPGLTYEELRQVIEAALVGKVT